MTYTVMDLQRFSIHDGPGIRTVVFLKGCPLHCPWCANPESQSRRKSLLYDKDKCVGCGICQSVCHHGAIRMAEAEGGKKKTPCFLREFCIGCELCGRSCPQGAISYSGIPMTTKEILEEVMKDADYYAESGGGVTLSGGEVFQIGGDLFPLVRKLKEKGLHIAVETCGQFDYTVVENCMPYVDLFLYDVKHVDKERLKAVTGGDVDVIMGNLRRLVQAGHNVIVRIPVIPGFNHTMKDMEEIAQVVKDNGIEHLELLPYHTLGKGKYEKLGRAYMMGDAAMLGRRDLERYRDLTEEGYAPG